MNRVKDNRDKVCQYPTTIAHNVSWIFDMITRNIRHIDTRTNDVQDNIAATTREPCGLREESYTNRDVVAMKISRSSVLVILGIMIHC